MSQHKSIKGAIAPLLRACPLRAYNGGINPAGQQRYYPQASSTPNRAGLSRYATFIIDKRQIYATFVIKEGQNNDRNSIMTYWDQKLRREQLDRKLRPFALAAAQLASPGSWVKMMRQALGMTAAQLARRVGISQSRITRIEQHEPGGEVKLATLAKIAEALDMKLFYGFVPNNAMDTLESLVMRQAQKLAQERLRALGHTMSLEAQQLSPEEAGQALHDLVQKILLESPKEFWAE